jgi:membrane protease YdiL (CAAX protease family)
MDGRARLSLTGACGLLALTALCWLADALGMHVFAQLPHAYRCLIYYSEGRQVHVPGFWESQARLAIFLVPVVGLCLVNPSWRYVLGLTLADPLRTCRWTLGVCAGCVAAVLLTAGGIELAFWLEDRAPPYRQFDVLGFDQPDQLFPLLWHMGVMCPLFEELGYRALPVPALERLGGRRVAMIGSGLIWAVLHWHYGRPLVLAPFYFVTSALTTWVFLRTRSLIPTIAVHAVFNASLVLVWYWVAF